MNKKKSCMHLVLNLPLDGIVTDHFYSVPTGFSAFFLISLTFKSECALHSEVAATKEEYDYCCDQVCDHIFIICKMNSEVPVCLYSPCKR